MKNFTHLKIKIVLAQIILYICLFFSFNNKTFFIPIFLFAFYLFWLLEDWRQAAWLTLVAILPFGWGLRDWRIEIPLPFNFLPFGKETPFFHFALSAKFLISIFLLFTLIFRDKKISFRKGDFFLFLFFLLGLISLSLSGSFSLGLISYFNIFQAIILYFLARYFLVDKNLFKLTIYYLLILGIFEGFLATSQFLLRRPLGRIIEESLLVAPYGKTAAEDIFTFRATGSFADPNTMAIFWLMVISLILSQVIYKYPLVKNKILLSISFLGGVAGLIFTFSRAAWGIFFLVAIGFVCFLTKRKLVSIRYKYLFLIALAGFLALLPFLIRRILSFHYYLWGKYSSGIVRIQLIQEAWGIIKQRPFFGVGPGNFLPATVANNLTGVTTHFLYPVHNLYLLFASELGLLALTSFLIFLILVLKESLSLKAGGREWRGIKWGILSGIFAYLMAVLAYTGVGVNLELFFLFLGALAIYESKTNK